MLKGVEELADAVKVTMGPKVSFCVTDELIFFFTYEHSYYDG